MGSAPLTQALVDRVREVFPRAALTNGYGTTETGPIAFGPHPRGVPRPDLSLGYPVDGVALRLVNGDDQNADEGVLELRTLALMPGYHNLPSLTAKVMTDDGYYVTGDVMRRDAEGFYYFVGRADDMFVCGGENIQPGEVETMLERHPEVAQACVVPVDDAIHGQKPVAFVVPRRARACRAGREGLRAHARPAYQHPRHVEFVDGAAAGRHQQDRPQGARRASRRPLGGRERPLRAVALHAHGGPEQLVLVPDFPDPRPAEGDVVLRVRACSLNYHDVFTRRGMPGINLRMPVIPGLDVAGEIDEVGPGVEGWRVGDRVLVDPVDRVKGGLMGETIHGGLAELCRAAAHQLIHIPDGVCFEAAAALPVAYGTAHRMMFTLGHVTAGEKVLILGASGGVGTCCVFLGKMAGAEVIACASTDDKLARLPEWAPTDLINYKREDFVATRSIGAAASLTARDYEGGVDVVVNFTGGDTWVKSLRCLRRGGRLLTCGATAGYDPKEDIRFIWTFELQVLGSNGWFRADLSAPHHGRDRPHDPRHRPRPPPGRRPRRSPPPRRERSDRQGYHRPVAERGPRDPANCRASRGGGVAGVTRSSQQRSVTGRWSRVGHEEQSTAERHGAVEPPGPRGAVNSGSVMGRWGGAWGHGALPLHRSTGPSAPGWSPVPAGQRTRAAWSHDPRPLPAAPPSRARRQMC